MPSSDSEDFESADEGHSVVDKKERKKRISSSNYSDNALETEHDHKEVTLNASNVEKLQGNVKQETDGWDDFDIDEEEPVTLSAPAVSKNDKEDKFDTKPVTENKNSGDTGWDNFGWDQDDTINSVQDQQPKQKSSQPEQDIKRVADRLAAVSTEPQQSSGWGWGWSVDSLLSTASAGLSTITSQVSQGISTVLETGIGAPDPEELARSKAAKDDSKNSQPVSPDESVKDITEGQQQPKGNVTDTPFPFGSLISGVTKFVETTGTKVISGGLDTLETIGKKTMEVLQEGDPGLAKKRALLGLDPGDKPVLSQVLREAKSRADEEDKIKEQKREAKEVHYENLFDDFEGLVHLEALEMLSRQVGLRIEDRIRGAEPDKRQEIKETLHQVAELCEMPEEDDEGEESSADMSKEDAFHERLQTATQDLGLKLQFQPLVKQYGELVNWAGEECGSRGVYKRGVSALAQTTALCMELFHKAAEMLLVKPRRSTADEADALTQMTVVLTKHISDLATLFTEKLNSLSNEDKDQINNYITNIFLEAGNSSTYIQNAFQLALPILQIGAV